MTRCCEACARKLETPGADGRQRYIVTPEGGRCRGFCPLCFAETVTQLWEITPRRFRYAGTGAGGGERARAGR